MGNPMTIRRADQRVFLRRRGFERCGHNHPNGADTCLNGRCTRFERSGHLSERSGHVSERSVHQVVSLNLSLNPSLNPSLQPPLNNRIN